MSEIICTCGHNVGSHADREAAEICGEFGCSKENCLCLYNAESVEKIAVQAAEIDALRAELDQMKDAAAKSWDMSSALSHDLVENATREADKLRAENAELRAALDGCDIAGPELMAENEKLRNERGSYRKALETILSFKNCNDGPAWNMQKIARAEIIRMDNHGL